MKGRSEEAASIEMIASFYYIPIQNLQWNKIYLHTFSIFTEKKSSQNQDTKTRKEKCIELIKTKIK